MAFYFSPCWCKRVTKKRRCGTFAIMRKKNHTKKYFKSVLVVNVQIVQIEAAFVFLLLFFIAFDFEVGWLVRVGSVGCVDLLNERRIKKELDSLYFSSSLLLGVVLFGIGKK